MTTRMDIKTWRKSRNGKAYAVRIGSSWTNDKGTINLEFDALPVPDENGRVACFLEEQRERDAAPRPQRQCSRPAGRDDDEVPF